MRKLFLCQPLTTATPQMMHSVALHVCGHAVHWHTMDRWNILLRQVGVKCVPFVDEISVDAMAKFAISTLHTLTR